MFSAAMGGSSVDAASGWITRGNDKDHPVRHGCCCCGVRMIAKAAAEATHEARSTSLMIKAVVIVMDHVLTTLELLPLASMEDEKECNAMAADA